MPQSLLIPTGGMAAPVRPRSMRTAPATPLREVIVPSSSILWHGLEGLDSRGRCRGVASCRRAGSSWFECPSDDRISRLAFGGQRSRSAPPAAARTENATAQLPLFPLLPWHFEAMNWFGCSRLPPKVQCISYRRSTPPVEPSTCFQTRPAAWSAWKRSPATRSAFRFDHVAAC
jgi:hypothetical protein